MCKGTVRSSDSKGIEVPGIQWLTWANPVGVYSCIQGSFAVQIGNLGGRNLDLAQPSAGR
jgi:hypothetical protein